MEKLFKEKQVMAEKKKEVKKVEKKITKYKITKENGNVIYRDNLENQEIKMYESKGSKVEGV